jgi:hypothetical protein
MYEKIAFLISLDESKSSMASRLLVESPFHYIYHAKTLRRKTHHCMMLSTAGAPLIPVGGSFCSRLKSRIRRRLAGVVIP